MWGRFEGSRCNTTYNTYYDKFMIVGQSVKQEHPATSPSSPTT